MSQWLDLDKGGILALGRTVAVAQVNSAPIKRLVEAIGSDRVIDLTFGRPRHSVVILDSGHVALVNLTPQVLLARLREVEDDRLEAGA